MSKVDDNDTPADTTDDSVSIELNVVATTATGGKCRYDVTLRVPRQLAATHGDHDHTMSSRTSIRLATIDFTRRCGHQDDLPATGPSSAMPAAPMCALRTGHDMRQTRRVRHTRADACQRRHSTDRDAELRRVARGTLQHHFRPRGRSRGRGRVRRHRRTRPRPRGRDLRSHHHRVRPTRQLWCGGNKPNRRPNKSTRTGDLRVRHHLRRHRDRHRCRRWRSRLDEPRTYACGCGAAPRTAVIRTRSRDRRPPGTRHRRTQQLRAATAGRSHVVAERGARVPLGDPPGR